MKKVLALVIVVLLLTAMAAPMALARRGKPDSAPLMLGGDIRTFDDEMMKLVTNKDLIRINQDEEGRPAFVTDSHIVCNIQGETVYTASRDDKKVFVKLLSDNEIAVLFANFSDDDRKVDFFFEDAGIPVASGYGLDMREVFTCEKLGVQKDMLTRRIPAHGCECYICTLSK